MEFFLVSIGLGIAIMGFFIGGGLKQFQTVNKQAELETFIKREQLVFIKEAELHHYICINQIDIPAFLERYPDIPHVVLNGTRYFYTKKLIK
ncbi:DNA-binding protein [Paraliobacillus salinarum]|uniref:DNA-binding protein n=1 Tax=Paraliobacillus salinarum TaxID=1158996 RepID=UPI0015F3625F|nr:DNA-binding protein [Paraliobacillus salinarum]